MLSFFPQGVLDEILNLIESVPEDFPSYSTIIKMCLCNFDGKRLILTEIRPFKFIGGILTYCVNIISD